MAAEREHSSSTSPPVRMVTMPAVSSSPLLWETVSWRQLSTVLYRCLKRGRGAIFQISGLCWRRGSKSEDTAELTRLQGPAVWVCLFQNCDPTLSDSGCTCRQKEELQKPSYMDVTETFLLREAGWKIQTGWNQEKKITSRPSFQAKMSTLEKVLFKISNTWLTICEDKTCKRPEWLKKRNKTHLLPFRNSDSRKRIPSLAPAFSFFNASRPSITATQTPPPLSAPPLWKRSYFNTGMKSTDLHEGWWWWSSRFQPAAGWDSGAGRGRPCRGPGKETWRTELWAAEGCPLAVTLPTAGREQNSPCWSSLGRKTRIYFLSEDHITVYCQ